MKPAKLSYNQIAGRSLERLAALSDGVFAFAMTLLVIDLRIPTTVAVHTESELRHLLFLLLPRMATYLMSFLTLGIFWAGQQTQLNHLSHADRHLSWIHFGFLSLVSLIPVSTNLLTEFITFRTALLVYWLNVLLLGIVIFGAWRYARRAGLFKPEVTHEVQCAFERRVFIGQALYATGAALCVVNTYVSIAFIVLAQLNFAIAPRIRWLSRL